MRKYLSLTELVDEYQGLFTPGLSKDQRRVIWKVRMLEKFHDLESCPCCESDVNSGVCFLEGTPLISWHNFGSLATITCDTCNLTFNGRRSTGINVIEQWNSINRIGSY